MKAMDSQLEQRISRHLDGQLTGQEQADLYRELLRDPQARQLMDDYAANDQLVTDALRAALGGAPAKFEVDHLPDPTPHRLPWRAIMGAAAMVMLVALGWTVGGDAIRSALSSEPTHIARDDNANPAPDSAVVEDDIDMDAIYADLPQTQVTPWWRNKPVAVQGDQLADASVGRPVVEQIRNAQLETDRAVLGVIDMDAETIYWLDMRNDQTSMGQSASEL